MRKIQPECGGSCGVHDFPELIIVGVETEEQGLKYPVRLIGRHPLFVIRVACASTVVRHPSSPTKND